MFQVGYTYKTKSGNDVLIVKAEDIGGPYHAVQGDDGLWRYARPSDAGRVTASAFDMSDPLNLVPPNGPLKASAENETKEAEMTNETTETKDTAAVGGSPLEAVVMLRRYSRDETPPPSDDNKLRSIKVLNQDGDSVYYSYGYRRWDWWLSVNYEEEGSFPTIEWWQIIPQAT